MLVRLRFITTILAAATLIAGYILNNQWSWPLLLVALGVFWLMGQRYSWDRAGWITFAFYVIAAANGIQLKWGAVWAPLGMIAALAAWDLDCFIQRLTGVGYAETRDMERHHVRRLLIVSGVGAALVAIALVLKTTLGFGVAYLLGLLALVGLSWTIGFLRRESD